MLAARAGRAPARPPTAWRWAGVGLRPGTLPVPLIVGLGAAAELAGRNIISVGAVAAQVKERFLRELGEVEFILDGDVNRTMSHVANVCFPGVDSEALMLALRSELAISNGSACTSASYSPSHVLKAMGLADELVSSAIRISWGPGITRIPTGQIVNAVSGFLGLELSHLRLGPVSRS